RDACGRRRKRASRGSSGRPSVALEFGLPFFGESLKGAGEVGGRHADCLGLRLHLDGRLKAYRPFRVELGLGDAVGEGRAGREYAGEGLRLGERIVLQAM